MEKVLPLLKKIESAILQDVVARKLASAIGVKVEVIYEELKKVKQVKAHQAEEIPLPKPKKFSHEEHFWAYVMIMPEVFKLLVEKLKRLEFLIQEKDVYKILLDYYNNGRDLSEIRLVDLDLNDEIKQKYAVIAVYLESVYNDDWNAEAVEAELTRILERWFITYKSVEKPKLQAELKEAELGNDKEKRNELLKKSIMLDTISIH